jgi:hypothetical protein
MWDGKEVWRVAGTPTFGKTSDGTPIDVWPNVRSRGLAWQYSTATDKTVGSYFFIESGKSVSFVEGVNDYQLNNTNSFQSVGTWLFINVSGERFWWRVKEGETQDGYSWHRYLQGNSTTGAGGKYIYKLEAIRRNNVIAYYPVTYHLSGNRVDTVLQPSTAAIDPVFMVKQGDEWFYDDIKCDELPGGVSTRYSGAVVGSFVITTQKRAVYKTNMILSGAQVRVLHS